MKRIISVFVGMLSLLVAVAACAGDDAPALSEPPAVAETVAPAAAANVAEAAAPVGDPAIGKQTFSTICAACHGPAGEGVPGLGKDMTTSEFIAGLSDQALVTFVRTGRPVTDPLNTTGIAMPPSGGNPTLTDQQLFDIVAYIRTIHKP